MKKRKLHLNRETVKALAAPGAIHGGRPDPATSPTLCFTCPCPPSIFTDCGF
ncbi:MAG TPA: hypothetical protein VN851_00665 [Thermoanaerobaculia bacterium]|nr:hypothetical protein [Thermoanaerobaculia bacterium]